MNAYHHCFSCLPLITIDTAQKAMSELGKIEEMPMDTECLFCKIASGEIPSQKVYEDDDFFAFHDINPAAPTHILVIPRKHIARITDATAEDSELLGRLILRANAIADHEGIVDGGFRYVFNCNDGGGQTVYHIHLHILGGRPMTWPPG